MNDLHGNPLPPLTSASPATDRYLVAILAELQWQRAQKTPPPAVAPLKLVRSNKAEETRSKVA